MKIQIKHVTFLIVFILLVWKICVWQKNTHEWYDQSTGLYTMEMVTITEWDSVARIAYEYTVSENDTMIANDDFVWVYGNRPDCRIAGSEYLYYIPEGCYADVPEYTLITKRRRRKIK